MIAFYFMTNKGLDFYLSALSFNTNHDVMIVLKIFYSRGSDLDADNM